MCNRHSWCFNKRTDGVLRSAGCEDFTRFSSQPPTYSTLVRLVPRYGNSFNDDAHLFPFNNLRFGRQGILGSVLCSFRIDGGIIPINKNLWSLSFVFITGSIAFGLLMILYITVDVLSWWSGAPFRYAGKLVLRKIMKYRFLFASNFSLILFKRFKSHAYLLVGLLVVL